MDTTEKITGWVRKTWTELKKIKPGPIAYIPPAKVAHPGAVHGPKIKSFGEPKIYRGKRGPSMTNHERVIAGRAHRMGISVKEYKRKFCM